MGYVYKITNTVNNKAYIGISIHEPEKDRIQKHLSGQGNRLIANAIKKYGKDAFTYEKLEANVFDAFLPDLEVFYIGKFDTIAPNGYNLTYGGDGPGIYSAQARRKISNAKKGKPLTEAHRRKISESQKGEKNHFHGKKHSAEARRKISNFHRGRKKPPRTEKHRRKISEAKRGKNHHQFGKPISAEHRRKLHSARRHTDYEPIHAFFLLLPLDMPLREKRKLLYAKFPNISERTIRNWVRKWSK